jgi:hypothetical protein
MIEEDNGNIKEIQKSGKPIRYKEIWELFFRTHKNEEKYIKPTIKHITSGNFNFVSPLILELRDLPEVLIKRFKKDPEKFINGAQKALYERLLFDMDVKEILELFQISPKDIHIIPDSIGFESLTPKITDLTLNKTRFKRILCCFEGRYMTIGLDKSIGFNTIEYWCPVCGHTFEKLYKNNVDEKIKGPNFCITPRCKNKTDFERRDSNTFEIGFFRIDDIDFKRSGNYLDCYILNNIDGFIEKIKNINIGEEVEVLGILRVNFSDLKTKKEKQRFEYWLEVFDIRPKKTKFLNKSIIKQLKIKLEKDNSYFEKLIDAIHPLTYYIDIYYPIKLLSVMSFITGGSWNDKDNIRDTLNSVIAGPKSTYKSSINRQMENIIGKRHIIVYEVNKKMTPAGLIGTTQRDSNRVMPIVRYGVLVLYSNGTIVFDEAQKIQAYILDILRCLEKGNVGGLQDALFDGPARSSLILSQNCTINSDGSFKPEGKTKSEEDEKKTPKEVLFDNLGWLSSNSESRLERFDLLYIIPVPDTFVKLRTLENEEKISKDILLEDIANDLELDFYDFPKEIITIRTKIEYLLFHYLHKAKEAYREINLSEDNKDKLRNLYRNALISKEDRFKTDTDVNIRSLNICYKVLKGLSSLRFMEKVENTSFNYFRKKCMKFIIPFRDSELIETRQIDMNKIFKDIFLEMNQVEVNIKDFIDEIKGYIKRTYYNDKSDDVFGEEIKDYIGLAYNLRENYYFDKLLKNNEKWLNDQNYFKESGQGKGKHTVIKKRGKALENEIAIVNRIEEVFKSNKYVPLEENSIRELLELEFNKELIKKALDYLWDNGIINVDKINNNLIRFKENQKSN